jgi:hypothetical protein
MESPGLYAITGASIFVGRLLVTGRRADVASRGVFAGKAARRRVPLAAMGRVVETRERYSSTYNGRSWIYAQAPTPGERTVFIDAQRPWRQDLSPASEPATKGAFLRADEAADRLSRSRARADRHSACRLLSAGTRRPGCGRARSSRREPARQVRAHECQRSARFHGGHGHSDRCSIGVRRSAHGRHRPGTGSKY